MYNEPLAQYQTAARNVFKSIPDEVILDMATRDFNMGESKSCVCGWAFRAGIRPPERRRIFTSC